MKKLLLVLVVGVLGGVVRADDFDLDAAIKEQAYCKSVTNKLSDKKFIEASKILINYKMKDPKSSEFRDGIVVKTKSFGRSYCVEVNSKNSFGGYTGFIPYIVNCSTVISGEHESKDAMESNIGMHCIPDNPKSYR